MVGKTLNDEAWESLFDRYDILNAINSNGFYEIPADDIRQYREPRLMCKFDHQNNLPDIFKQNKLSVLPLSTKGYIIGDYSLFKTINYDNTIVPQQMTVPNFVDTVKPTDLYSEASALHCAYISGMINDFLGEDALFTVSGRMGTGVFDYDVLSSLGTTRQINVKGAQIEIDGGYETYNDFMVVEAKKTKASNFNIRQLYYPYRVWKNRTHKNIRPIFFTISNDIFYFFEYAFTDDNIYNSLELVSQKTYTVNHERITQHDVDTIANRAVRFVTEPQGPFPQADDFTKVVDLLGYLYEEDMTAADIAEQLDFNKRQSDYYYNCCLYLGLANKYTNEDGTFATLNAAGRRIMNLPFRQKYLTLAEKILEHRVFKEIYDRTFHEEQLSNAYIVSRMKANRLYNIGSDETFKRRASTIRGWVRWIKELPNSRVR
jgi:hypothetical protein